MWGGGGGGGGRGEGEGEGNGSVGRTVWPNEKPDTGSSPRGDMGCLCQSQLPEQTTVLKIAKHAPSDWTQENSIHTGGNG